MTYSKATKNVKPSSQEIESRLQDLFDIRNPEEVAQYLSDHPKVLDFLPVLRRAIKKHFPDSTPSIEVYHDTHELTEEQPEIEAMQRLKIRLYAKSQHPNADVFIRHLLKVSKLVGECLLQAHPRVQPHIHIV